MKLRNKKTGEIKDWDTLSIEIIKNGEYFDGESYHSLAELNEDWEDYEEPKEFYFICEDGEVYSNVEFNDIEHYKEIGNYFETKEQAEKAVERLKAWKRLKDARFEFEDIRYKVGEKYNTIYYGGIIPLKGDVYEDFEDDLNLLFGGENEN